MDEFLKKKLPINFLNYKSYKLFKSFDIFSEYQQMNPVEWNDNPAYQSAKSTICVDSIQIVNDTAVKRVKLMEDFNNNFTENYN